jgi:predicted secreted protein
MAQPDLAGARELLLYYFNPGSPSEYLLACGINSRSIDGTLNATETAIMDCADPTAMPVRRITGNFFSEQISGSGQMAQESLPDFEAIYRGGVSVNWRIGIVNFGYWEGPFLMTNRNIGGEQEGFVNISLTLQSDGEVEFTSDTSWPP